MAAFLAAQAWSMFPVTPVLSGKAGEEGKVVKKVIQRCKDYDEKGFCMKGDMCPYEHGVDHIVVPGQDQTQDGSSGACATCRHMLTGEQNTTRTIPL